MRAGNVEEGGGFHPFVSPGMSARRFVCVCVCVCVWGGGGTSSPLENKGFTLIPTLTLIIPSLGRFSPVCCNGHFRPL